MPSKKKRRKITASPFEASRGIDQRAKKPENAPGEPQSWPRWVPWVMGIWCVLVAAIYYAKPVDDGDLWWQMAYGHYMLENGTLIPDHTIYSWTPTQGSNIYCAWIGEIVLYCLYTLGGLPILFFLRYLVVAGFIVVCLLFAKRVGVHRHPLTWFMILLGLLMCRVGSFIKPELFSLAFTLGATGLWFWIKSKPHHAKLCYLFPVIMLVWVNTHGAFIFGAMLYFLIGAGEVSNVLLSRQRALPVPVLRHLLLALALSGCVLIITPYGIDYPLYLANRFTQWSGSRESIEAYQSVFSIPGRAMHLPEYLYLGSIILAGILILAKPVDVAVLFVVFFFAFLYATFLRTTYFFAPILSLTALYYLSLAPRLRSPTRRGGIFLLVLSLVLMLVVGGRANVERLTAPGRDSWIGFDYSYCDPVIEADFVKRYLLPQGIGNSYSAGGYLLWALRPDYKVMVDPRAFPYEQWLEGFFRFEQGRQFNSFFEKYPCSVFVVKHQLRELIEHFLNSPEWRIGFVGPTAAIFVRKEIVLPEGAASFGKDRFARLKNPLSAFYLLGLTIEIADFDSAQAIITTMMNDFRFVPFKSKVAEFRSYYDAMRAVKNGEVEPAIRALEACRKGGVVWNDPVLINLYNRQTYTLTREGREAAALNYARRVLSLDPNDPHALLNAGALGWWMEEHERENRHKEEDLSDTSLRGAASFSWRASLEKFLRLYGQGKGMPVATVEMVKKILAGTYHGGLILLSTNIPQAKEPIKKLNKDN